MAGESSENRKSKRTERRGEESYRQTCGYTKDKVWQIAIQLAGYSEDVNDGKKKMMEQRAEGERILRGEGLQTAV